LKSGKAFCTKNTNSIKFVLADRPKFLHQNQQKTSLAIFEKGKIPELTSKFEMLQKFW
jgi:hypothetical protein